MSRTDTFSSRWGVVLVGLGMAVGTGNIWRFPRVVAENGGGAFLVCWLIFLFTWSIPLLITEFGIGRKTKRGPIAGVAALNGAGSAWMGGFVVVTTVMIMFYYSVVTGWALKYAIAAGAGSLGSIDPGPFWSDYSTSFWQPSLFHILSIGLAGVIVARGVTDGIERASRILIPILFGLLLCAVVRAVTLPGASAGLAFLFVPDFAAFMNYQTWLEALTQSAWSTGAGWGLLLSYAIYVKNTENVVSQAIRIGIGNNLASILAAMAILPAAFAVLTPMEARDALSSGNIGLTFVWIPRLFNQMPAGNYLLPVFFVALFCAALSSLIAMVELASRALIDRGLARLEAVRLVVLISIVCGLPSAFSLAFFENQDWVWSLGLMISGMFIAVSAIRFGARKFREQLVNTHGGGLQAGPWYDWCLLYFVPVQFAAMFAWWMYQSVVVYEPGAWWNPFRVFSVGTCVLQWGAVLIGLRIVNRRLLPSDQTRRATLKV